MKTFDIKILTSTVVTCAVYAKEVLGNDLSGLAGGGCGGSGGGCGCGGGSDSLLTEEDLVDIFNDMDGYTMEVVNHDHQAQAYYDHLLKALANHGVEAAVHDQTVEYIKSTQNPIVIANGSIVAMGRLPENYELIVALETGQTIPVGPAAGF